MKGLGNSLLRTECPQPGILTSISGVGSQFSDAILYRIYARKLKLINRQQLSVDVAVTLRADYVVGQRLQIAVGTTYLGGFNDRTTNQSKMQPRKA